MGSDKNKQTQTNSKRVLSLFVIVALISIVHIILIGVFETGEDLYVRAERKFQSLASPDDSWSAHVCLVVTNLAPVFLCIFIFNRLNDIYNPRDYLQTFCGLITFATLCTSVILTIFFNIIPTQSAMSPINFTSYTLQTLNRPMTTVMQCHYDPFMISDIYPTGPMTPPSLPSAIPTKKGYFLLFDYYDLLPYSFSGVNKNFLPNIDRYTYSSQADMRSFLEILNNERYLQLLLLLPVYGSHEPTASCSWEDIIAVIKNDTITSLTKAEHSCFQFLVFTAESIDFCKDCHDLRMDYLQNHWGRAVLHVVMCCSYLVFLVWSSLLPVRTSSGSAKSIKFMPDPVEKKPLLTCSASKPFDEETGVTAKL